MPKSEEFVVKYSDTIATYLISYQDDYQNLVWGSAAAAITFPTLGEAEALATAINAGTLGVPKPRP